MSFVVENCIGEMWFNLTYVYKMEMYCYKRKINNTIIIVQKYENSYIFCKIFIFNNRNNRF